VPVDEGARDHAFVAFRRRLQAAVARRDTEAVLRSASPEVLLGFEGERGREQLRSLITNQTFDFWSKFGRVLALGGKFEGDEFVAPYVTSAWDPASDCSRVIVGHGVRLRAGPNASAAVLATLDYDVVELWVFGRVGNWEKVRLATGVSGYVSNEFVRSPLDYRAHFRREGGRWQLTVFVGGD
jgi:hypothetical protein